MWRWALGIFLILHGITHAFVFTGSGAGYGLLGLTIAAYAAAGVAVVLRRGWAITAIAVATAISAILLAVFWNGSSLWGLPIDAAIVAGLVVVLQRARVPAHA